MTGTVTVKVGYPPNIDQIRAKFRLSGNEIFAWDGVIYSPRGATVSQWLQDHEKVHFRQQRDAGGPAAWWYRYLVEPAFRLDQEMEAHIVEYRTFAGIHGRKDLRRYLDVLAKRLASPMYGGMITRSDAKRRIKAGQ